MVSTHQTLSIQTNPFYFESRTAQTEYQVKGANFKQAGYKSVTPNQNLFAEYRRTVLKLNNSPAPMCALAKGNIAGEDRSLINVKDQYYQPARAEMTNKQRQNYWNPRIYGQRQDKTLGGAVSQKHLARPSCDTFVLPAVSVKGGLTPTHLQLSKL